MIVYLDPRVGNKEGRSHDIGDALAPYATVNNKIQQYAGDVVFIGNGADDEATCIYIELKTVSDFVSSMMGGRLSEQITKMYKAQQGAPFRIYVIIEGVFRQSQHGLLEIPRGKYWGPAWHGKRPLYWTDFQSYITSLEEAGARVRYTRSSRDTVMLIGKVLCGWWSKPYDSHDTFKIIPSSSTEGGFLKPEDETLARIRRVVKALKVGIGWERSKAVADAMGSVHRLVIADSKEWAEIEGIGKTIAAKVRAAICATYTPKKLPRSERAAVHAARAQAPARSTKKTDAGSRQRPGTRTAVGRGRTHRSGQRGNR